MKIKVKTTIKIKITKMRFSIKIKKQLKCILINNNNKEIYKNNHKCKQK